MFKNFVKKFGSRILERNGRAIERLPLAHYLRFLNIDCVFDIGANIGQFGQKLRRIGYKKRIESFEPIASPFKQLTTLTNSDTLWNAHNYAIGDQDTTLSINILKNNPSSSFLSITEEVKQSGVSFDVVGTEAVQVKQLDTVFDAVRSDAERIYLKIDTQGFERNVILGASKSLSRVQAVQMEVSLVPNYTGELLIEQSIEMMRDQGFSPWWISSGFKNPKTLQMYQAEMYFLPIR